jgi:hypothetical protein
MKKDYDDDELRAEYDLSQLPIISRSKFGLVVCTLVRFLGVKTPTTSNNLDPLIIPKGRYASERRTGKNLIILDPDIAEAFPNDEAVNSALRLILQISQIPHRASTA